MSQLTVWYRGSKKEYMRVPRSTPTYDNALGVVDALLNLPDEHVNIRTLYETGLYANAVIHIDELSYLEATLAIDGTDKIKYSSKKRTVSITENGATRKLYGCDDTAIKDMIEDCFVSDSGSIKEYSSIYRIYQEVHRDVRLTSYIGSGVTNRLDVVSVFLMGNHTIEIKDDTVRLLSDRYTCPTGMEHFVLVINTKKRDVFDLFDEYPERTSLVCGIDMYHPMHKSVLDFTNRLLSTLEKIDSDLIDSLVRQVTGNSARAIE